MSKDTSEEGWFPEVFTRSPRLDEMKRIFKNEDELAPPGHWSPDLDHNNKMVRVSKESDDYKECINSFESKLKAAGGAKPGGGTYQNPPCPNLEIVDLFRIENKGRYCYRAVSRPPHANDQQFSGRSTSYLVNTCSTERSTREKSLSTKEIIIGDEKSLLVIPLANSRSLWM